MSILSIEKTPSLSPGACRRCGTSSDRDWFLNVGYIEEFYGQVYYCNLCIAEMSDFCGFIPKSIAIDELSLLQKNLDQEHDLNTDLRSVYDALLDVGIDLFALADFLHAERTHEPGIEGAKAMGRREKRLAKQAEQQGSDDVPNDVSNVSRHAGELKF